MPVLNTAWKDDNYGLVNKVFASEYGNQLNKLDLFLGSFDTNNSADYSMTHLGGFGEWGEYNGTTIPKGQQKRGFTTIITPTEWALGAEIGHLAALLDKLGEIKKTGTSLARGGAATVRMHMLRMLGNAYNTNFLGGDGLPWASDSHPIASKGSTGRTSIADTDAGVFSNVMTSAISVAAISQAEIMAGRYVTPDGLPMTINLDTILCSLEDEATVKKLIGGESRLMPTRDPESNTNAANPLKTDYQYIVVSAGTEGFVKGQWAICDRTLVKESAGVVYTVKPQLMQKELDNPLIDLYVGYSCFGVGFGDAKPIIFSRS